MSERVVFFVRQFPNTCKSEGSLDLLHIIGMNFFMMASPIFPVCFWLWLQESSSSQLGFLSSSYIYLLHDSYLIQLHNLSLIGFDWLKRASPQFHDRGDTTPMDLVSWAAADKKQANSTNYISRSKWSQLNRCIVLELNECHQPHC
ncbi:hypothetical protein SAY87_029395 [Trapa incisa]|uniref:Uncharacterized protein n=1 Tax=Trapa incisa TaxID=236973 RepID=A0AAN7KCD9_9MYRT|nr:hypothetical protein SAY87_029395 [Trapa incisa]